MSIFDEKITNQGGLAFPFQYEESGPQGGSHIHFGLTARDYFAAKAMHGLVSNFGADADWKMISDASYELADAMLKAREAA